MKAAQLVCEMYQATLTWHALYFLIIIVVFLYMIYLHVVL